MSAWGVAHAGATGGTAGPRREQVWMTCSADGHDHMVDERRIVHGSGRFPAVCGHVVLAASLAAPPGAACPGCLAVARSPARPARRRGRHAALRTADDRG